MAKPTERALKRKPKAVILLTVARGEVKNFTNAKVDREFEWFETDDGMHDFFDQNVAFHKEDATAHDDMAFMAVEVTSTADMTLGRTDVQPETDETTKWMTDVKSDISKAYVPVKSTTSSKDGTKKVVVRARRKTGAAAAVQNKDGADAPETKAANLKARLAAKKDEQKPDASAPAPKAAAPKRTAAKKKADEPKAEFVVKKSATASA